MPAAFEIFDTGKYLQPLPNGDISEKFAEIRERMVIFGDHILPPIDAYPVRLNRALYDIALANPGKLLRPCLAVACAHELGGDILMAYRYGWVVELLHISSLILDDLPSMDNSPLRRGKQTVHMNQGEGFAILLSAYAHNTAMQLITSESNEEGSAFKFLNEVYKAIGGMGLIGGQVLDLEFRKQNPILQYADAYRIKRGIKDLLTLCNLFKTAPLFRLSVFAGTVTTKYSNEVVNDLCQCGDIIGMIFQLLDDEEDGDIVSQKENYQIQVATTREERMEEALFHYQEIHRILVRNLEDKAENLFSYFSMLVPDLSSENPS
jgi:geranylgeranyl pyrophosphate synthase